MCTVRGRRFDDASGRGASGGDRERHRERTMNASSFRTPSCCNSRNTSVLADVIATPITVGIPNNSFSASAVPITSGTSLATIASSVMNHNAYRAGFEYSSRITRERCHPVASANLTARACMNSPHAVAHRMTHSREYPKRQPAWRSLSKFPGSTYPMHIRNPGPRNLANFRHENVSSSSSSPIPSTCTSARELDVDVFPPIPASSLLPLIPDDGDATDADAARARIAPSLISRSPSSAFATFSNAAVVPWTPATSSNSGAPRGIAPVATPSRARRHAARWEAARRREGGRDEGGPREREWPVAWGVCRSSARERESRRTRQLTTIAARRKVKFTGCANGSTSRLSLRSVAR